MSGGDHVGILLDIKENIGALNAQMMEAARSRQRLEERQIELSNTIAPLVATVADMKPKVENLTALQQKFGGVVLTLSVCWGLICGGAVYFSDAIKAKLHL